MIDTPLGKAALFDGVDDALFIDRHPAWPGPRLTFEALIRPDGGDFAQRWFHLASDEPVPARRAARAADQHPVPVRAARGGEQWYLDAFVNGPGHSADPDLPRQAVPGRPLASRGPDL